MNTYRNLTDSEIARLEAGGTTAEAWSRIVVSTDFRPEQLSAARLEGDIVLERNAVIRHSRVANYRIGADATVEDTPVVECRSASAFGNGTPVAVMNENGGRTVRIYRGLSAQVAYIAALYRHRPRTVAALDRMASVKAAEYRSALGTIGRGSRISGCRFIRETDIGAESVVEGASILCCGSIGDHTRVGIDVRAYDFIAAENVRIDNGSTVERCYVGECCILDRGFTATDSLFFANSHCENGEAVSVFAGPYTVSHHKASLLIAGMFSFFNAGSGTNQSNHLFKSGAVHQSLHRRGCKFASNAYVMAPAAEGPYTMILGRHTHHHDTSALPFSYLLDQQGHSALLPGINLSSYGTVRDIAKWRQRDRRTVGCDRINFENFNPYIGQLLEEGIRTLQRIARNDPDAAEYLYNNVTIKAPALHRGIARYDQALEATIGALLHEGNPSGDATDARWIDAAGQYITRQYMERVLDRIDDGTIDSPEKIDREFRAFAQSYADRAHDWALAALARRLGHRPSHEEVRAAIETGERARERMEAAAEADRKRDEAYAMAVGYGIDAETDSERIEDYRAVRRI